MEENRKNDNFRPENGGNGNNGGRKGGKPYYHGGHRNNRYRNGRSFGADKKNRPDKPNGPQDERLKQETAEERENLAAEQGSAKDARAEINAAAADGERFGPGSEARELSAPLPEQTPAPEEKTVEVIGVRFRTGGKVYYFAPGDITFASGEHAIVETVRGVEYGEVALGNRHVRESEVVFPLKSVIRKATPEDDRRDAENRRLEEEAKPVWFEKVAKNGLSMQLVDVEYTHDNSKLCFYFTADGRVDFRELVKDLAGVFHTRIELRQIGVRDEAKLFGGLGSCGRPFCCNTFLPDFAQVSIKMAKEQNLSLSSAKISGACGRLMCCLRFEQDTYEREYATFPKVDTIVETPKGRGVIVESSFLTGRIKVRMNDDQTVKTFGKDDLKPLGVIRVKEEVSEDLKQLEDK